MKAEARHSEIHGTGLFALEEIAKDETFLEYTGRHMTEDELWQQFQDTYGNDYQPGDLHVWAFEVRDGLYIDGDTPDNIAKYANHSCDANCEAIVDEDRIWISAKRKVATDEELTFDYRFPLRDFLYHPCQCEATNCCGYIVAIEERVKLRKILRKQAPRRFKEAYL
mgnify:FL=1